MISNGLQNGAQDVLDRKQLNELVTNLNTAVNGLVNEDQIEHVRQNVMMAAQAILSATKAPSDQWWNYSVAMAEMATIRCWMKWKAFDTIPPEGSISYKDLAQEVDADEGLIVRMAGIMVSTGTLKQIGDDQIAHTHLSKIYINDNPSGLMFQMLWDEANVPYAHWPEYFEKYGRKEPRSLTHNPFPVGYGKPEATVWEIRAESLQRVKDFAQTMNTLEKLLPVTGMYDFNWIAQKASESPDRALLVDVGGSKGQTINAIVKENPAIDITRCVLQDRPEVLSHALAEIKGCMIMPHDFWNEQPVKGAVAYSIRRCLHDYPDDKCVIILSRLAEAMASDSKVLITEQIMESPPSQLAAQTDLCMMNIGGKERTERNFYDLAARSGLKVTGIFKTAANKMGVVECVKV